MMRTASEFLLSHECYLHTFDQRLNFDAGDEEFTVGSVATGDGGAHGTVKSVTVSSGSWGSGTAAGYLVLSNVVGTFVNDEGVTGNPAGSATVNGVNFDYVDSYGKRTQTSAITVTQCRFINVKAPSGETEYGWKGRFPVVQFSSDIPILDPADHGGANQRLTTTETRFAGTFEIQWPPIYYPGHISCALKAVT